MILMNTSQLIEEISFSLPRARISILEFALFSWEPRSNSRRLEPDEVLLEEWILEPPMF